MISLIAAHDLNRTIGLNGKMPWGQSLKADLKWFREVTEGNIVVMGRRTYDSIGAALPKRINIVLTRDHSYTCKDAHVFYSIERLVARLSVEEEVFIIGGEEIYNQFLPIVDRLYITQINSEFDGDTYFPEYNTDDFWVIYEKDESISSENPYELKFRILERK